MNVDFTKPFNKQFEKLPRKAQEQVKTAVALLLDDAVAPSLRNHALKGKWEWLSQIRAIYGGFPDTLK